MENKEQRGPNPTAKTVNLLIARAGGRCQFKNWNRNIFLDKLTLTGANNSNVAHIVASSPNGPRGNERSLELYKRCENADVIQLSAKQFLQIADILDDRCDGAGQAGTFHIFLYGPGRKDSAV